MGKRASTLLALHLLLAVYSAGGICSKLAAGTPFLSPKFCLLYGGLLVSLAIYALGWQQILKRMSLTAAFANKAVTVVWGIVFGALFFNESITAFKIIGAILIIAGVVLYAIADNETSAEDEKKDSESITETSDVSQEGQR